MKANCKQQAVRARLLKLGFTPIAEADFSSKGGAVIEFWHSLGGNTIRVVYKNDKVTV